MQNPELTINSPMRRLHRQVESMAEREKQRAQALAGCRRAKGLAEEHTRASEALERVLGLISDYLRD